MYNNYILLNKNLRWTTDRCKLHFITLITITGNEIRNIKIKTKSETSVIFWQGKISDDDLVDDTKCGEVQNSRKKKEVYRSKNAGKIHRK
jgi:hypothetical protein